MGDVAWTLKAREAVARTLHDIQCQGFCDGWDRHEETDRQRYRADAHAILPALIPHVEPMLREARAEALDEVAAKLAEIHRPGSDGMFCYACDERWPCDVERIIEDARRRSGDGEHP